MLMLSKYTYWSVSCIILSLLGYWKQSVIGWFLGLGTETSISVYPNFICYVISRHCGTFFSGIWASTRKHHKYSVDIVATMLFVRPFQSIYMFLVSLILQEPCVSWHSTMLQDRSGYTSLNTECTSFSKKSLLHITTIKKFGCLGLQEQNMILCINQKLWPF